jgi:hypothetical protein
MMCVVNHVLVLGVGRHPLVEIESCGWEVVQRYPSTVATTSPSLALSLRLCFSHLVLAGSALQKGKRFQKYLHSGNS